MRRSMPSPLFPYTTLFRSAPGLGRPQKTSGERYDLVAGVIEHIVFGIGDPVHVGLRKNFAPALDWKSTRLYSSHLVISYTVFCLKIIKYNTTFLLSFYTVC